MSSQIMSPGEAVKIFIIVLIGATIFPLLFIPLADWAMMFERPLMEIIATGTPYYIVVEFFAFFTIIIGRAVT